MAGRPDEAERPLLQAFSEGPPEARALSGIHLADLWEAQGKREKAIQILVAVIDLPGQPHAQQAHLALGVLLQEIGEHEASLEALSVACGGPDRTFTDLAKMSRGTLRHEIGDSAGAMAELAELALSDSPYAGGAANCAAIVLWKEGKSEEAEEYYLRAIVSQNPDDRATAAMNLGMIQLDTGRAAEAKQTFLDGLASPTSDESALTFNLGLALYADGEFEAALDAFLAVWDGDDSTQAEKGAFNAAALLHELGRASEAREAYGWVVSNGGEDLAEQARRMLADL